jgi:uncharacterized protein (DUF362 family)
MMAMQEIDRREFLRKTLLLLAASGFVSLGEWAPVFGAVPVAVAPTLLAVAKNGSPEALTRAALAGLGGMGKFVSRGDAVIVKPNIGWDRTPEQAANSHPEVVKAVVAMCLEAGAKSVRVMDRPCNDPRRCYQRSGIQPAILSLGAPEATIEFMDERKFVEIPLKNPQGDLKSWTFYKDFLEADKVINIPVAKHHNATRLTMSLKNVMGILGGNRGNIHHDLDRNIAELNAVFKFHLHVLDAVRILTANGPQGGRVKDVRDLHTVAASTDPVALDAYGATLFGLTAGDVPHIQYAARLGLGSSDLAKVKLSVTDLG